MTIDYSDAGNDLSGPSFRLGWLAQDWHVNQGRYKIQVVLLLFRLGQAARFPNERRPKFYSYVLTVVYLVVSEWVFGIELPIKTEVGPRLRISHGVGLVVNEKATLGSDIWLRNSVTIGNKEPGGDCPIVGPGVSFGAGAVAVGGIRIAAGCVIGANSVVVKDTEPGSVYAGVPAKRLGATK